MKYFIWGTASHRTLQEQRYREILFSTFHDRITPIGLTTQMKGERLLKKFIALSVVIFGLVMLLGFGVADVKADQEGDAAEDRGWNGPGATRTV